MISEPSPTDGLAFRRRLLFFGVVGVIVAFAASGMGLLPTKEGWTRLEMLMMALFLPLILQLAYGFTLSVTGFWLLRRGGDPVRINNTLPMNARSAQLPRTAIVMPIFNEDVARVFQGIKVMALSLRRCGHEDHYDFFVLSDSSDPNLWIAEEKAWLALKEELGPTARLFYRKRRVNLHNKSGNVADFCRRWGADYRYMIVLDADSVMTGDAMVRLTHLMEAHPEVGIIQSSPKLVLGRSLFQRAIQFVAHLYGPLFAAGSNYWQLGSGTFWGHNAILRIKPFMRHCAMPELPPGCPLGRRILSHDTVEAALMRKAGYEIWLAHDVEGSYEESPPNLNASLKRDRRWCFGNLQHAWLLGWKGFHAPSRVHLLNGIMAYVGSPIWLLFLLAGTAQVLSGPESETAGADSGVLPAWLHPAMLGTVLVLLFLPKLLALVLLRRDPKRCAGFGGFGKAARSVALEIPFSVLLAPILMLFHSRFVVSALTGFVVKWGGQKRKTRAPSFFRSAVLPHWINTLVALLWAGVVAWASPGHLAWMLPVLIGPIGSIPFSYFTASEALGARLRRRGIFLTPPETAPPAELVEMGTPFPVPAAGMFRDTKLGEHQGLAQALLDPFVNAVHLTFLRVKTGVPMPIRRHRTELARRLIHEGPDALSGSETKAVLWDHATVAHLHRTLWSSSARDIHESWAAGLRHYRDLKEQHSFEGPK